MLNRKMDGVKIDPAAATTRPASAPRPKPPTHDWLLTKRPGYRPRQLRLPADRQPSGFASYSAWVESTINRPAAPPLKIEKDLTGPNLVPTSKYRPSSARAAAFEAPHLRPHAADVVRGVWSCCQQLAPNTLGCLSGPHSFDNAQCAQCGLWLSVQEWRTSVCRYHRDPPTAHRYGSHSFGCCGAIGLEGTKYSLGVPLKKWTAARNTKMHSDLCPPCGRGGGDASPRSASLDLKRATKGNLRDAQASSSGCLVGMHMPTLPPEGVALRCAACGNEANDARCETCQCILQQCTQCFEMVPLLTDVGPSANTVLKEGGDEYELDEEKVAAAKAAKAAAEEETEGEDGGERKGKLAPKDLPIHSCRFHPGVFCESRATRFAVRQRREAVVCPHMGCGLRMASEAELPEHANKCEYQQVRCPYGCKAVSEDAMTERLPDSGGLYDPSPLHDDGVGKDAPALLLRRRDLKLHLDTVCPFAPLPCLQASLGCKEILQRRHLGTHLDKECNFNKVACKKGCGAIIYRGNLEDHCAMVCPLEWVACENGCGMGALRSKWIQIEHNRVCTAAPVTCQMCLGRVNDKSKMDIHLKTQCPNVKFPCRRCDEKVKRGELWLWHDPRCLQGRVLIGWRAHTVAKKEQRLRRAYERLNAPGGLKRGSSGAVGTAGDSSDEDEDPELKAAAAEATRNLRSPFRGRGPPPKPQVPGVLCREGSITTCLS